MQSRSANKHCNTACVQSRSANKHCNTAYMQSRSANSHGLKIYKSHRIIGGPGPPIKLLGGQWTIPQLQDWLQPYHTRNQLQDRLPALIPGRSSSPGKDACAGSRKKGKKNVRTRKKYTIEAKRNHAMTL